MYVFIYNINEDPIKQLANNMKGSEQRKTNNVPTFVTFQWAVT